MSAKEIIGFAELHAERPRDDGPEISTERFDLVQQLEQARAAEISRIVAIAERLSERFEPDVIVGFLFCDGDPNRAITPVTWNGFGGRSPAYGRSSGNCSALPRPRRRFLRLSAQREIGLVKNQGVRRQVEVSLKSSERYLGQRWSK